MNNLKVGVNFDFVLLDEIIKLNETSTKGKITELYGSDSAHHEVAARPEFRLPDIDKEDLEAYVSRAKDAGISFNYTMNSFMPFGSKVNLWDHKDEVVDFIKYLESIGVYRITIANPLMLEIIRNYAHSDIEIEVSTCAHIDTITQIKYYHQKYGVNKVCGNLNKNRDFEFLTSASEYCRKNNIIYELMVNEFCGVGGEGYATHCIYRDSCYMCHATNATYNDTLLFDEYPMNICTNSRNADIVNWLRLKWIRPEDLAIYNNFGLNHFKITGRTGSSEYILKTLKAYLDCEYDGNLIELWKPLESIKPGTKESEVRNFYIDNKKLNKFLLYWANGNHKCDNEVCGETCNYCKKYYDTFIKGE